VDKNGNVVYQTVDEHGNTVYSSDINGNFTTSNPNDLEKLDEFGNPITVGENQNQSEELRELRELISRELDSIKNVLVKKADKKAVNKVLEEI